MRGSSSISQIAEAAKQGPSDPAAQKRLDHLLRTTERLDAEELRRAQLEQLRFVLGYSLRHVPYYRDTLTELKSRKPSEVSLDTLRELPILTREQLQTHGASLLCTEPARAHQPIASVATSGSTGQPIESPRTRALTTLALALRARFHRWHGRDANAKAAFITAVHEKGKADPPDGLRKANWAPGGRGPAVILSLTTPVEEQLEWLRREDPVYLATFATNALELARLSEERGITLPSLRDVVVSSEIVPPELADACARVWGATLSCTYSASEVGAIALSHPQRDGYAVQAESVIVEVVDDAGRPCPPARVGRVLITTLQDGLRPLIRYAIGDYAEWDESRAPQRASSEDLQTITLPFLKRVTGRERNMLTLPDGGRIWPLFPIKRMLQISPVQQWQMVQTRVDQLLVRIVCKTALSNDQQARLCRAVAELIPSPMHVELERVDAIPRGAGGKYEDFINAVPHRSFPEE